MRLLQAMAAVVLAASGGLSLYRAWAASHMSANTLEGAREAARLDPGNAAARLWLAEHLDREGHDPGEALSDAIALREADSGAWIRRGLAHESGGRPDEAERDLLHAAAIDGLWEPRWSLVNFYFRQGREEEFWNWVRSAISITGPDSARDLEPLWNLCWRWPEGGEKSALLAKTKPISSASFLAFLEHADPADRALQAAEAILMEDSTGVKLDRLPLWSTRLLEGGRVAAARAVWRRLAEAGVVVADDERFEKKPAGDGFGWRVQTPYTFTDPGLALRFDGKQAETMDVLWRYSTRGGTVTADWDGEESAGFTWRVEPTGKGVWRVVLGYRRPLGVARFQGVVRLRAVRVGGG
ncbi:MAG: hypothetical protein R2762_14750 [Bryobacteraceae bacterium]